MRNHSVALRSRNQSPELGAKVTYPVSALHTANWNSYGTRDLSEFMQSAVEQRIRVRVCRMFQGLQLVALLKV